jgi:hypothetical protein
LIAKYQEAAVMETTKEAYKMKMEAQLKIWSARVAEITAKAEKASAEAKVQLLKQADDFKAFEVSAKKQLSEMETAAAEGWQKVKDGFEQKWNQLSGSVEAMWAKVSPDSASKS